MLRGAVRSSALRRAAAEVSRLPEFQEAQQHYSNLRLPAALRQLERVQQVMRHVPSPPVRLVASGALALALRSTGALRRESDVWVSASTLGLEPPLQLHALSSAAMCALHRNDGPEALRVCEEAAALYEAEAEADEWAAVFGVHRALALPDEAGSGAGQLESLLAALESRADAPPAVGVARLLLGDKLAALGRADAARPLWQRNVLPAEVRPSPARGGRACEAEGWRAQADAPAEPSHEALVLAVVSRVRLGRLAISELALEDAHDQLKCALQLCETRVGGDGVLLHHVVAELAAYYAAKPDPIVAEGLYRSAIDGLLSGKGRCAPTLVHARFAVTAMNSYAEMLANLEWNGAPRTSEADAVRRDIGKVRNDYAEAFPDFAQEPLVVDPWLDVLLDNDWLASE
ncbi:hypothetical protein AB1Y20_010059 [Prymnesium parvum]|uniref:KIF-binding protein n=1 Tax=Prymnesium parvum TaxID=97485 RepID=A0AB34K3B9_PRYPA